MELFLRGTFHLLYFTFRRQAEWQGNEEQARNLTCTNQG